MDIISYLLCISVIVYEAIAAHRNFTPCPQVRLKFGKVRYRQRGRFVKFICNTGYIIAGEKYSTCINSQWDNPVPVCVRPTCKPVNDPPNGLIFPSHRGGVLNFFCKSGYQLKGKTTSFCDGRRWSENSPTCISGNSEPALSCDFEDPDLCGWTHDFNHDFEWIRHSNVTPSGNLGTGPQYDHTRGEYKDGHYMYIESSNRYENDTARLVSPLYSNTTTDTCFEFYYHMWGLTIGELRVYLKKASEDWYLDPQVAFFRRIGDHGNHWYRSFTHLGPIPEDFQIVIEGVRGTNYIGDIAIDDVKLILDCEMENDYSTTEFLYSSEPTMIYSCANRCLYDMMTTQFSADVVFICDCDDLCEYLNTCCPDYFDLCVFSGTDDDSLVTDEPLIETTELSNDIPDDTLDEDEGTTYENYETTELPKNYEEFSETNLENTPTTMIDRNEITISHHMETVREQEISSSKTMNTSTIFTTKEVSKQASTQKKLIPTTQSSKVMFTTKFIPKARPTLARRTTKQIIQTTSSLKRIPETRPFIQTTYRIFKPTSAPKKTQSPVNFKDKINSDTDKQTNIEYFGNMKEFIIKSDNNSYSLKMNILISCMSLLSILAAFGMFVAIRKYKLPFRVKRMSSGRGDSQSDVRFLTSDEVLDLRLSDEYDM